MGRGILKTSEIGMWSPILLTASLGQLEMLELLLDRVEYVFWGSLKQPLSSDEQSGTSGTDLEIAHPGVSIPLGLLLPIHAPTNS